MRILLIGPPGCGKGTQGARIAEAYGIPHIAAGDILRAEVEAQSAIGAQISGYMAAGELVPDDVIFDVVVPLVRAASEASGYVLDGFPRSMGQAVEARRLAEEYGFALTHAVYLHAPAAELVGRLLKRAEIEGRTDDNEEVIARRLAIFEASTEPLLAFYEERGLLHVVDATLTPDDVTARILEMLPPVGLAASS